MSGARPAEAAGQWDLRQEYAHPDLREANRAILEDLQGGVTSVLFRLDAAARNGLDADDPAAAELAGREGIAAYSMSDLDAALADVELPMAGISALKLGQRLLRQRSGVFLTFPGVARPQMCSLFVVGQMRGEFQKSEEL